ncbi:hypothetical protein [Spirillospora sp. CA-128828]|uniref:hypothetical protein n=1 Tax=Spirillospora sp. CA-128828 TaxID=3240033 RepID=UPI003D91FE56
MSDQGERGVRWTDMSESEPENRPEPGADDATGPRTTFPEPKVPEVFMPAPTGRTEFSGSGEGGEPHDIWGKVEAKDARVPGPAPAEGESTREPTREPASEPAPEDVKVAPVSEDEAPHWEGSLFDEGGGDDKYVPAVPTGAGRPAKPGKPSSGNWQMPDWMADEASADAKLGGDGPPKRQPKRAPKPPRDVLDEGGGRSRLVLFGGIGLLVVALIAAGGVYLLTSGGKESEDTSGNADQRAAAEQSEAAQVQLPPDRRLTTFSGRPSRMLGRVKDVHSGLAYPRLAAPWQVPTKKNKLGTPGWSGQQILVTERHAGQLWYGQLLTGTLLPSLQSAYQGPDSVKNVTGLAAQGFEAQYYAFPHKSAPLASQALTVDGHPGWLIATHLTYKRAGVRATGEVVATAVIDTGRPAPAVVFASMPNTHRNRWPDLNEFFAQLKIAS